MNNGDAIDKNSLESEFEFLYCLRDMAVLFDKRQKQIYGKSSEEMALLLENLDEHIDNLGRSLGVE